MTKLYAKLAQSDKDVESASYVVKPDDAGSARAKRSCCFTTFVTFAVLVMICGGVAIVVGIFFTPQVNTLLESWRPATAERNQSAISNSTTPVPAVLEHLETTTEPPPPPPPSTDHDTVVEEHDWVDGNSSRSTSDDAVAIPTSAEDEVSEAEEYVEEGEEQATPPPTPHPKQRHGKKHRHGDTPTVPGFNATVDGSGEAIDRAEEKFASWMIRLEQFLERETGIHRPELVVPLFMLLCFVASLALVSCCCWVMVKRRESHRRRILGKIITDLQTGDSKSVLLDRDEDD